MFVVAKGKINKTKLLKKKIMKMEMKKEKMKRKGHYSERKAKGSPLITQQTHQQKMQNSAKTVPKT